VQLVAATRPATWLTRWASPWGVNDPDEGTRTVISDPWDIAASEFTWNSDGTKYNTTRGNNGIAQTNPNGGSSYLNNYRPTSTNLNFEYEYTPSMPTPSAYANASITQLFYTANMYHDLLYELGFTEAAGNFEINNNGQGGTGNDFVILNSQDGSGTDNANFATPPDGQAGRMRMYLWTYSTPRRDCCFESGVVIHEYSHGRRFALFVFAVRLLLTSYCQFRIASPVGQRTQTV
jgi:extracellular elastinolytic metalloproteinase